MSSTYSWLRALHLAVGLFAAVFLTAYALSAAQMAWAPARLEQRTTTRSIELPVTIADAAPRAQARWLMSKHGLRGDLEQVGRRRGAVQLRIYRPGTEYRVEIDAAARSARVTTRRHGTVGVLNRLHHAHGFGHDDRALDLWGAALLAVSLGLLALGASGLAMWYLRHRHLRWSAPLLVVSLASGLALLVLVRLA